MKGAGEDSLSSLPPSLSLAAFAGLMPVGVFHRPAFCTVLFYARPQNVGCLRLWGSRLFRRSVRIELPADWDTLMEACTLPTSP